MNNEKQNDSGYLLSITIIGALFFIFGFVTWLNGILIPYLKIACELNNFEAYFVTFAFYISYFVMAIPAGLILKKTGFKNGMMFGLLIMAVGALTFIPAALTRQYSLFLLGLFIVGTGLSILQTASNPYITILGPIESAAKRISIMGICNKIAGVLSPIILGAVILTDSDNLVKSLALMDPIKKAMTLDSLAHRVIVPYVIMAIVLVLLSAMVKYSKLPDIDAKEDETQDSKEHSKKTSVFQFPNLVLGVLAIFLYVGAEVIAADTIISYGTSLGFEMSVAKFFTSLTLIAMVAGYIVGILLIPKVLKQDVALTISSVLALVFSILAITTSGYISIACIALLGLANSLMWPTIWPLAIDGLGKFTKIGSSLLIMGIAGGALLPLLYGRIVDISSAKIAYSILIPCYAFILFYSMKGYKIGKKA